MGCGNKCSSCFFNGNCDMQDFYDDDENEEGDIDEL